jgi:aminoglycoside 6'-N-acetyltransferase
VTTSIRPLAEADIEGVVAVLADPGVMEWWGTTTERDVREDLGKAFVIEVGGELAGYLQVDERTEWEWRSVEFDIAVADRFQGRGHGPAALRAAVRHFAARGHHRFEIGPAARNERAIRAYAKVGFKPVGVLRQAGKVRPEDPYEDDLLMDLLLDELT